MTGVVLGIDMHAHIVTPDVLALLEREGEHYQTRILERDGERLFVIADTATRRIDERVLALDAGAARVRDRDAEGIDREVLSCVPFLMYPDVEAQRALAVAQTHNDSVAALAARRPDRFVGWAAAPLQEARLAARELERAHGLGLGGVMIPPSVRGQALDEDAFEVFWEAAAALAMPVFIHPFEARPSGLLARYNFGNLVGNLTDTGVAAAAIVAGGVLERHPRLRVILAHAGGTLPSMIGRIDNGFARSPEMQARLSRSPATYLNQLWLDTIAYNPPYLRALITLLGAERFVLGSDYPVGGPPHPAADVRALGLSDDDTARILRGNAESLLAGSSQEKPRGA